MKQKIAKFTALGLGLAFAALPVFARSATVDSLTSGFANPPQSARPQAWWHWMNGNITKAGITADLEAMEHIGLGGATIVNVDCGVPRGTVNFMSPEWRDDFKFAVQEAHRLGLVLCVENCAGWSSSGGPWNTPANAMQCLTSTETRVDGPVTFDKMLAQPTTKLDTYHDIAVLAFKDSSPEPEEAATIDATHPSKLVINRALYETLDGSTAADVTRLIVKMVNDGKKFVRVKNEPLGGDPATGQYKQLRLEFTLDGKGSNANGG